MTNLAARVSRAAFTAIFLAACTGTPTPVSHTVLLADFEFRPEAIEVPAGSEVTLTLINRGNAEHVYLLLDQDQEIGLPLAVDEANVLARVTVDVAGQETVTLTAPADPGEYPVVCTIPGHAEAGMFGAWIVR